MFYYVVPSIIVYHEMRELTKLYFFFSMSRLSRVVKCILRAHHWIASCKTRYLEVRFDTTDEGNVYVTCLTSKYIPLTNILPAVTRRFQELQQTTVTGACPSRSQNGKNGSQELYRFSGRNWSSEVRFSLNIIRNVYQLGRHENNNSRSCSGN
jgi:hypothetical protein